MKSPERGARRRAEVAGYNVGFLEAGEGPDVLLLHGLGASGLVYSRNIEALAQTNHVTALDLPGHGESADPGPPYDAESGMRLLSAFIEQEMRPPVAVVGNSLGGFLAGLVAAERPDLVDRVALLSAPGFSGSLGWRLRMLALPLAPRLAAVDSPLRARSMLRGILHDRALATDELARRIANERASRGSRRAIEGSVRAGIGLRGMRDWRSHSARLAGIAQPTLLVWGAQDRIVPPSVGRAASRLLPHASLHVLERCGHWPQFEQPTTVNALLGAFLNGHSAASQTYSR
jgi:pimeloyl-ACP methyl ester carboxylesterase